MAHRVTTQAGVNITSGDEPILISRLRALANAIGKNIVITSGFRTVAQQAALQGRPGPVAAPGKSQHQLGRAADAEIDGKPFWQVVSLSTAQRFGLATYPGGTTQDPVHVEVNYASNVAGGDRKPVAKAQKFDSTAYGPPWGGIQGGGTTATGINLLRRPHKYIVAVDPSVIPLHSKLRIWPNPFSNKPIIFAAEDTGGAIKGNRIDFYDWRGRRTQNLWGHKIVNVEPVSGSSVNGSFGRTRPGDPNAGPDPLDTAFALDFADDPSGMGAATPDIAFEGDTTTMQNVGLFGLPSIVPLPKGTPGAGTQIPAVPDALSVFRAAKDAVNSTVDFLKWIAWIFHPRNILRVVEGIVGLNIIGVALYIALQQHTRSGNASNEPGTFRRAASRAVQASPAGRAVRVRKGMRAGRREVRQGRRREEYQRAQKRGRTEERKRGDRGHRRDLRRENRQFGDNPPF